MDIQEVGSLEVHMEWGCIIVIDIITKEVSFVTKIKSASFYYAVMSTNEIAPANILIITRDSQLVSESDLIEKQAIVTTSPLITSFTLPDSSVASFKEILVQNLNDSPNTCIVSIGSPSEQDVTITEGQSFILVYYGVPTTSSSLVPKFKVLAAGSSSILDINLSGSVEGSGSGTSVINIPTNLVIQRPNSLLGNPTSSTFESPSPIVIGDGLEIIGLPTLPTLRTNVTPNFPISISLSGDIGGSGTGTGGIVNIDNTLIGNLAVTAAKIANNTITNNKISNIAFIGFDKLQNTLNNSLIGRVSGIAGPPQIVNIGTGFSITGGNTLNAIGTPPVETPLQINLHGQVQGSGTQIGDVVDIPSFISNGSITGTDIAPLTLDNSKISNNAQIQISKLEPLHDFTLVGNMASFDNTPNPIAIGTGFEIGGTFPTFVLNSIGAAANPITINLSGDVSGSGTQTGFTVNIPNTLIGDNAVTINKIANNSITNAKITGGAGIQITKFQTMNPMTLIGNILNSSAIPNQISLGDGFFISGSTLSAVGIAAPPITLTLGGDVTGNGVQSGNIITVPSTLIANGAINEGKILNGAVTDLKVSNTAGISITKLQSLTSMRLLGNVAATAGAPQQITIGSGFTITGGNTLNAVGSNTTLAPKIYRLNISGTTLNQRPVDGFNTFTRVQTGQYTFSRDRSIAGASICVNSVNAASNNITYTASIVMSSSGVYPITTGIAMSIGVFNINGTGRIDGDVIVTVFYP